MIVMEASYWQYNVPGENLLSGKPIHPPACYWLIIMFYIFHIPGKISVSYLVTWQVSAVGSRGGGNTTFDWRDINQSAMGACSSSRGLDLRYAWDILWTLFFLKAYEIHWYRCVLQHFSFRIPSSNYKITSFGLKICRFVDCRFSVLSKFYFETIRHIRPHLQGPSGGLKVVEGSQSRFNRPPSHTDLNNWKY